MGNPKDKIQALLQKLSESVSHENVVYYRHVLEKVQHGLQLAESEGVVAHADARARLSQWLAS
jgi:hypothetical protein